MAQRGVVEEGAHSGEAQVAGPGAVAAAHFQVVEEGRDHGLVQVVPRQGRGCCAARLLHEAQQQAQGIPIRGDGPRARLALAGQPLAEESLQCRGHQGHLVTAKASRRAAAWASSSGAADKYQYV